MESNDYHPIPYNDKNDNWALVLLLLFMFFLAFLLPLLLILF